MDARQVVLAPDAADATTTGAAIAGLRLGFRALSVAPGIAARLAQRFWFTPPRPRIREDVHAFLKTGERLALKVNDRPVVAWKWGSGPAVILMHGWGGFAGQMQAFVHPLVRAGFQAITFDAPAHGASGPSRFGARRATLFDFADVLRVLAREQPEIAGVIAHSGGCTAAAWTIRTMPQWSAPPMVFLAPMASALGYQKIFQRALGLSDEVMRRFRANTERELEFRWEDLEVPAMAAHMTTPPVLVVHDHDDRETSWSEGQAIAIAWPGAQLQSTTGLGHRRILRDPTVVEAVVRFVSRQSPLIA
jgi:pimeloyl-ACP methyl ester carboxylesterase